MPLTQASADASTPEGRDPVLIDWRPAPPITDADLVRYHEKTAAAVTTATVATTVKQRRSRSSRRAPQEARVVHEHVRVPSRPAQTSRTHDHGTRGDDDTQSPKRRRLRARRETTTTTAKATTTTTAATTTSTTAATTSTTSGHHVNHRCDFDHRSHHHDRPDVGGRGNLGGPAALTGKTRLRSWPRLLTAGLGVQPPGCAEALRR